MMKRILLFLLVTLSLLTACSKEEDIAPIDFTHNLDPQKRYSTIGTLRRSDTGTLYLQIDENARLALLGTFPSPYSREGAPESHDTVHSSWGLPKRIFCDFQILDQWSKELNCYCANILWWNAIDEGYTNEGPGGDDGVDIIEDWMTCLTDGYLTLHLNTWWGDEKSHEFGIQTGKNPDDPFEIQLWHNAWHDPKTVYSDYLITFRLETVLPVPDDPKNTMITLVWRSEAGETLTKQFPYWKRN